MNQYLKNTFLIFLTAVIGVSWWYGYETFKTEQGNIAISLGDIVHRMALPFLEVEMALRKPVDGLPMPVYGVKVEDLQDTWGDARTEGRTHEGIDILAPTGTPVFSSTVGYVTFVDFGYRGGRNVIILGPGAVRYYYAHFTRVADGIQEGSYMTPDTVLGFVGTSGNAAGTPPHLHFGVYPKTWEAINPFGMIIDRW